MDTKLIIDNEHVTATGGATFTRISSTTGKVVTVGAAATVADAVKAADSVADQPDRAPHHPAQGRRRPGSESAGIHQGDGRGSRVVGTVERL
jgi:acyl-CoA reductase-like NAD-dependent aldehyde dehydrogenase